MYRVKLSRRYKTAFKRLSRHKDFDRNILEQTVRILARGEKLDPRQRDHQLAGEFKKYRECHLQHDPLLMYQIHENVLVLLLVNLGTHDDIFR